MPKPPAWIVDPPTPFAPRAEWEAHLEGLLATKKRHRTRALDGAIKDARRVLDGDWNDEANRAAVARYTKLLLADLNSG